MLRLTSILLIASLCGIAAAQVGGYGSKETVGTGTDAITLLRLGGTRYQMGYWYGYLLSDQIAGCMAGFEGIFTDEQYAAATTALWNSDYFDTVGYGNELQGMADGCAASGHSELTFEKLRRLQLLPDMSETGCGLYACWGTATKDGHLYQLRNLDWSMDLGAQDYPVVAIYSPTDGNRHAVVGFAGIIGAFVGGMGSNGTAVSQIMGGFCDAEGTPPIPFAGIPFGFLLRDCTYHDQSLSQSLNRIHMATRTNQYYYCISGKDAGGRDDALLLFTSRTRCDAFGGGESALPHPCYDPVYPTLPDVVYWKRHDGGAYATPGGVEDDRKGNQTLYNAINARYGNIDSEKAIEIARADGVSGTVVSIVYDTTAQKFWVAFADGPYSPATEQEYVQFDMSPQPAYSLGEPAELLDAAFYAGQVDDGSDVAGRMAFWGQASHDGQKVAFYATNANTQQTAVFTVNVGDPSSWQRMMPDTGSTPSAPIYWTPDDLYLIVGDMRISVETGEMAQHSIYGFRTNDSSMTYLPSENWLISYSPNGRQNADMIALPIWRDGQEDPTREPVILTDLYSHGIECDWPFIDAAGSKIAFVHYGSYETPTPDFGDIYVLKDVPAIMAAPKVSGTLLSSLAPSSLSNASIVPIHTGESANFTHVPSFSQDLSLVFFTEDRNNVFRDDDFFNTLAAADFDVVIRKADGTGDETRFAQTGNQVITGITPGGVRVLYIADVAGRMHLYVTTFEVTTQVVGAPQGNNDILTGSIQTARDASGTTVTVPAGVTINFPDGAPQEIQISAPVELVETPLIQGTECVQVAREFGPSGTTFSPPITVTISYTDAEVAGYDEAHLRVFTYNSVSGIYDVEITNITNRDLAHNTISFLVDHFSKFALGAALDNDGDGIEDALDPDDDNDGILDGEDPFPLDTDNDVVNNIDDPDDDGDGIPDGDDAYPQDTDNDGLNNAVDADDDADGIPDTEDLFPFDTDNDGSRNDVDTDDDGDGISDVDEGFGDPDGDKIPNYLDVDSDGDGMNDDVDEDPYHIPMPLHALGLLAAALAGAASWRLSDKKPRRDVR